MSLTSKCDLFSTSRYTAAEIKAQKALKAEFTRMLKSHFVPVFEQARTARRILDMLSTMIEMGPARKTLTNNIIARGRDQKDWTSDYRAFREGVWRCEDLFHGVFKAVATFLTYPGPVVMGIDGTGLPKTGTEIENVGWIYAPLLPKCVRPAIQWGVPMLHAAILLPGTKVHLPTAITVAFEPIPRKNAEGENPKNKNPKGKDTPATNNISAVTFETPRRRGRPTKEEAAQRKREREQANADTVSEVSLKETELAVEIIRRIRQWMDEAGLSDRLLLVVGDGGFTNKTVLMNLPDRVEYIGRARPDARLQGMGKTTRSGKVKYGMDLPTPKQLVESGTLNLIKGKFHYGGKLQDLYYHAIGPVFRKGSTRQMPLRLLILEPTNYGKNGTESVGYNERCFLLTTDFLLATEVLAQGFLYRWALEQTHRDLKNNLGVGQAQVQSHRLPSAMAAFYALLQVAIRKTFGEERTAGYAPVPKWTANRRALAARKQISKGEPVQNYRPSVQDISHLLKCAMSRKGIRIMNFVA